MTTVLASGDILFSGLGSGNDYEIVELREVSIAAPITKKISQQIACLCEELPEDKAYLISWIIKKGKMIE